MNDVDHGCAAFSPVLCGELGSNLWYAVHAGKDANRSEYSR